jgi:putative ABC transport system ATP-binding protein
VAQYAKRIVEVRDGHIIRDHPVEGRRRAADDLRAHDAGDGAVEEAA